MEAAASWPLLANQTDPTIPDKATKSAQTVPRTRSKKYN
jgi:hypothetical protein